MTDAQLIPFGFSTEQDSLVDVSEVPRGRACRCVCPACHTPLIARKGDVRQAHFAHASRNVYADTEDACDFSVFVAARLMLKQIIGRSLWMDVPAYLDCVADDRMEDLVEWFTVTEASRIELTDIKVETSFGSVLVDVAARVGGHRFVVYVSYPGRPVPEELTQPHDPRCGVLELCLDNVATAFAQKDARSSYREVLMTILAGPGKAKRWLYHPRYSREKAAAEERLRARAERVRVPRPAAIVPRVPQVQRSRMVRYACVICGESWEADGRGGISDCGECHGRLCARPVLTG